MGKIFTIFILIFYCPAALWLSFYGINNYYMVYLFLRKGKKELFQNVEFLKLFWLTHTKDDLPKVTTQLPALDNSSEYRYGRPFYNRTGRQGMERTLYEF